MQNTSDFLLKLESSTIIYSTFLNTISGITYPDLLSDIPRVIKDSEVTQIVQY